MIRDLFCGEHDFHGPQSGLLYPPVVHLRPILKPIEGVYVCLFDICEAFNGHQGKAGHSSGGCGKWAILRDRHGLREMSETKVNTTASNYTPITTFYKQ